MPLGATQEWDVWTPALPLLEERDQNPLTSLAIEKRKKRRAGPVFKGPKRHEEREKVEPVHQ